MEAKKTALDKLWNLLILLIVGEVSTAFNYGYQRLGWLIAGFGAIVLLSLIILSLSKHLEEEEEK